MFLFVPDKESPEPLVLRVETEREKEVGRQLKQANDATARLQDELRQAEDRERERATDAAG